MSEVVVVGSFKAKPGKEAEALEAFKALVEPTHARGGLHPLRAAPGHRRPRAGSTFVERWAVARAARRPPRERPRRRAARARRGAVGRRGEITVYEAVPRASRRRARSPSTRGLRNSPEAWRGRRAVTALMWRRRRWPISSSASGTSATPTAASVRLSSGGAPAGVRQGAPARASGCCSPPSACCRPVDRGRSSCPTSAVLGGVTAGLRRRARPGHARRRRTTMSRSRPRWSSPLLPACWR